MERKKKQFLCKYCGKIFTNGRVLGGHMRAHLSNKKKKQEDYSSSSSFSYLLRANPRKSWKFDANSDVIVSPPPLQGFVCSVCGKDFHSPKSLFGHLRHHSGSGRGKMSSFFCKECGNGYKSAKSLSNHSGGHCKNEPKVGSRSSLGLGDSSEAAARSLVRRKRSFRMRYKNNVSTCSSSSLNESSYCVNEIDLEMKEVAASLLMLSREVRKWHGFPLSDSQAMCAVDEDENENKDEEEIVCVKKKQRVEKLDSFELDDDNVLAEEQVGFVCEKTLSQCSEFDSKVESDQEMPGLVEESETSGSSEKKAKSGDDLMMGLDSLKPTSIKRMQLVACGTEMRGDPFNKMPGAASGIFECKTCHKIFHSYRALGGHQTGHRVKKARTVRNIVDSDIDFEAGSTTETEASDASAEQEILMNGSVLKADVTTESPANDSSIEQEIFINVSDFKADISSETPAADSSIEQKIVEPKAIGEQEHKCQICFKAFVSGRALGGHKRAHANKPSETREQVMIAQQELLDASGECNPLIGLMSRCKVMPLSSHSKPRAPAF